MSDYPDLNRYLKDISNFDNFETVETLESLEEDLEGLTAMKKTALKHGQTALAKQIDAGIGKKMQQRMAIATKSKGRLPDNETGMAQFDVVINRLSNNIPYDIPFVLWGVLESEVYYKAVINRALVDAGVPVTFTGLVKGSFALSNTYQFQFADTATGLLKDFVNVTIANGPTYPFHLETIRSGSQFTIATNRMTVLNAALFQTQLNKGFLGITSNRYGSASFDQIGTAAYFDPQQFQSNMIDVNYLQKVDVTKGLLGWTVYNLAGGAGSTTDLRMSLFITKM